jgi:hypothetical protein
MVGQQPEAGVPERLDQGPAAGFVLGRYQDAKSGETRYAAMGLVKRKPGLVEILVTECATEQASRELVMTAMEPYR